MRQLLALFSLTFIACSLADPLPREGTFSGLYSYGFEHSEFRPSGRKESWWLSGSVPCRLASTTESATPILFVEFKAQLSPQGEYGHLGKYAREVTPTAFSVCRPATQEELAK